MSQEKTSTEKSTAIKVSTDIKDHHETSCSINVIGLQGTCKHIGECPSINEINLKCGEDTNCLSEEEKNLLHSSKDACNSLNFNENSGDYHVCCDNSTVKLESKDPKSESSQTESPATESTILKISSTEKSIITQTTSEYLSKFSEYLPTNCGTGFRYQIDGGNDTKMTKHPWLAALMYKNETNNQLAVECSGSIITERFVLTAAHCLTPKRPEYVRIGEYQFSTELDCTYDSVNKSVTVCNPKHLDLRIDRFLIHKDYVNSEMVLSDDIGLIKTSKIIQFNSDQNNKKLPLVLPVCLPSLNNQQETYEKTIPDEIKTFEVAGWGKTSHFNSDNILVILYNIFQVKRRMES